MERLNVSRPLHWQQVNATMFMALLTAYNVLLACYSSEEDLVCGLPYAGRSRAETEGTSPSELLYGR